MNVNILKRLSDYAWEIPRTGDMLVPGRIFADKKLVQEMDDKVKEQISNVACLPGIVKASLAMPDAHWGYGFCVKGDTKVLTKNGYYRKIKDFDNDWRIQCLKTFDLSTKDPTETSILKFMKLKPKKLFRLKTKTGREIFATSDHPFYTNNGMIPLEKLSVGDKVTVFPFEGVIYKKPSKKVIVSENHFKKTLLELERKPGTNGFDQNIQALRKRNLLKITYDHELVPYILKIMGFVFGDGSMNLIGKRGDGIIHFSGKKEDLEDIRKDIYKIGYAPSPIHTQKAGKKKEYINYSFCVNATSLLILLKTLGVPIGKKVFQSYNVPVWIKKAVLWQKRLFLASLFGAELRRPYARKNKKTMFSCPVFPMSKSEKLIGNAKSFLKDISKILKEFGVETLYIDQRKKHVNKKGDVSWELDLVLSSKTESLINLWSKVSFEYNRKRSFQASVSVQYLKLKQLMIKEKERAINVDIPELLKQGLSYREISSKLATPNPLTKRFIEDICWKLNKGFKNILPQTPRSFPSFDMYSKEVTDGLGCSGMVWDKIAEIKEVKCKEFVYDFTVSHPDHNFIAESFVVSNCIGGVAGFDPNENGVVCMGGVGFDGGCGVNTLSTNLFLKDVQPRIKQITDHLFNTVPAGLGNAGKIRLSRSEADELFETGAPWIIKEKGFGVERDLEFQESNGHFEGAKSENVSDLAKKREKGQVGTLGSGNHYLEIQYVDKVYDEEAAKAFGLELNQVCVSIHCGSRALGHQIGTDYLKILGEASKKYNINVKDRELVSAPINSDEGQKYISAMLCALNYAFANRQVISHLVREGFKKVFPDSEVNMLYSLTHNSARFEKHDGKKLLVHRKGATRAFGPSRPEIPGAFRKVGQPVLVGGSMGTASYILHGTDYGTENSFGSSCHGSGRAMSRTQAKKQFYGEKLVKELSGKGIYVRGHSMSGIAEEAPGAYKDVNEVIESSHQSGLAKRVVRVRPLGNIKG